MTCSSDCMCCLIHVMLLQAHGVHTALPQCSADEHTLCGPGALIWSVPNCAPVSPT